MDGHVGSTEKLKSLLDRRRELTAALLDTPYDLVLYLQRAVAHSDLGYPDLASGDAYRALMLADEVLDRGLEYHEQALESLQRYASLEVPPAVLRPSEDSAAISDETRLARLASTRSLQLLAASLLACGCLRSAHILCERGLATTPSDRELLDIKARIAAAGRRRLGTDSFEADDLPWAGSARREVYPWNSHEPDRLSAESLAFLNAELAAGIAPKCEVRASELPVLPEGGGTGEKAAATCLQLGVFAREDIAPGEAVLREYSALTANNRLQEPVCDACGEELPPLGADPPAVACDRCAGATVFCGADCADRAQGLYHPAVCDKAVDAIAKDPAARDVDHSLYLLLLARVLAMSTHQDLHPLDVREVKYIWGDFVPPPSVPPGVTHSVPTPMSSSDGAGGMGCELGDPPRGWTLPFSFLFNVEIPLHVLEKMDVDIYATLARHDVWVFNTLYAKFRGTASSRKSTRDGRPDVAAVHPFWCLANHDCDPNVTWEWGGRMTLKARETRVVGHDRAGGIRAGEEILNHYCDVDLPVQERREWAAGSLGGWCMCRRCRTEAAAAAKGNI